MGWRAHTPVQSRQLLHFNWNLLSLLFLLLPRFYGWETKSKSSKKFQNSDLFSLKEVISRIDIPFVSCTMEFQALLAFSWKYWPFFDYTGIQTLNSPRRLPDWSWKSWISMTVQVRNAQIVRMLMEARVRLILMTETCLIMDNGGWGEEDWLDGRRLEMVIERLK